MVDLDGARLFSFFAGGRQVAQAIEESGQRAVMLLANGNELQSEASAGPRVAHHSLRGDFALLDQKMQFGFAVGRKLAGCFDKEPARAQVSNAGNIFASFALPKDPRIFRNADTRGQSS